MMPCLRYGWLSALLLVSLSGCATAAKETGRRQIPPPQAVDDLTWWLAEHLLTEDENSRTDEVDRTGRASVHLVQIRDREPLHIHQQHDLEVMVHQGHGTLHLGSERISLKPGKLIRIPRGTPHAFINHAKRPAVAFAVFFPPFDGMDTVVVDESRTREAEGSSTGQEPAGKEGRQQPTGGAEDAAGHRE